MRPYQQKRSGFAMIMAIFFMIVIATLLSYMLSSTTETAKRTTNLYVTEQAQLMAKSGVEYAILAVSGHDRNTAGCINQINTHYPDTAPYLFDINISIQYFGFGSVPAGTGVTCNTLTATSGSISTAESNGTMMIDVYVQNNEAGLLLSEPIRYHRRTLQKL